ncbi:hypothetical protein DFA_04715 [Cavenderia fasciculata]|uniref:F-box domain-containing protein n=1 Tax=Cavenderia fasciculata TaxID=261658 RepID=F4PQC2_CACFS|nr:uncharacterized protein DFA_04715 [Cavenderia fasciculata]EGG22585.1 hypothetical protein DFA_04715 [Cavenderia fasciculata]|eukprot:XP_004360436.1 hypothetical protein DFA_04715 [Cavenderia fasciculata]
MIETLPNTVIKLIIEEIDGNTDKICFLLTCKKLFHMIDNHGGVRFSLYDIASDDALYEYTVLKYGPFKLNTFKKPIEESTSHLLMFDRNLSLADQMTPTTTHLLFPNKLTDCSNIKQAAVDKDIQLVHVTLGSGSKDNHRSIDMLPDRLDSLNVAFSKPLESHQSLPHLNRLIIGTTNRFPFHQGLFKYGLKELIIERYSDFNKSFQPGFLPNTLTKLVLPASFDHDIGVLPPHLKYLKLNEQFSQTITKGTLPDSLETLLMPSGRWGHEALPESLCYLSASITDYSQLDSLPKGLEKVKLDIQCPLPLPLVSPLTNVPIQYLTIKSIDDDFKPEYLNKNVKRLGVNKIRLSSRDLTKVLPDTLEQLLFLSLKINLGDDVTAKTILPKSIKRLQITREEFEKLDPEQAKQLEYVSFLDSPETMFHHCSVPLPPTVECGLMINGHKQLDMEYFRTVRHLKVHFRVLKPILKFHFDVRDLGHSILLMTRSTLRGGLLSIDRKDIEISKLIYFEFIKKVIHNQYQEFNK